MNYDHFMRKPGHHLVEIGGSTPSDLLDGLSKQFSITTAEELIAAIAQSGERLRGALRSNENVWSNLIHDAHNAIGPEEVRRLSAPVHRRPTGAKLAKLTSGQRIKYAGGIIIE